jgi:hypothetical protein
MPLFIFFFALTVLYGQPAAAETESLEAGEPSEGPSVRLDSAVKSLAAELQKKISAEGNPKIALGQWVYGYTVPPLGFYWAAQLAGELANIQNRSFTLVSGESGGVDWTVSGEIIETLGAIRVYTRLIRSAGQSIEASFHADFEADDYFAYFAGMFSSDGDSFSQIRDPYERDGLENPLAVEIASGEDDALIIRRTIHSENDEDFFLLAPTQDGALTIETTGNMDAYIILYDAASLEQLAYDDDSGDSSNARIRRQVDLGNRYIAKVGGYDGGGEGIYGFRAWMSEIIRLPADEYEDDDLIDYAKDISPGIPQQHSFTTGDDVDWVKFQVEQAGSYTISARGVNSSGLDTYIELYDDDLNSLGYDDDSGEDYDSSLSLRLQAGTYYLKVECFDSESDQPYTISVKNVEIE